MRISDWSSDVCSSDLEVAGIRVPRLRTGIVLDAGEGALAKMLPLFKVGLGGRFGSGRQWMSWVALEDEVRAIRFLLEADLTGPVNSTAPKPDRKSTRLNYSN